MSQTTTTASPKNSSWSSSSNASSPTSPSFVTNNAILSSPSSSNSNSTRRWRHKKHFQTIVNKKRYEYGSPMQAVTPASMEADMRRVSIRDSLSNILDNIDTPSLD